MVNHKPFYEIFNWQLVVIHFSEKHLEMEDKDSGTRFMTLRVTPEQEAAMEAFFQINNWALIKEGIEMKRFFLIYGLF